MIKGADLAFCFAHQKAKPDPAPFAITSLATKGYATRVTKDIRDKAKALIALPHLSKKILLKLEKKTFEKLTCIPIASCTKLYLISFTFMK